MDAFDRSTDREGSLGTHGYLHGFQAKASPGDPPDPLNSPIDRPTPSTPTTPTTAARAGPLAAAGKNTPEVGPNEYVPAGLTRAQWAEIKAADAAKKANKKPRKTKVEVRADDGITVSSGVGRIFI